MLTFLHTDQAVYKILKKLQRGEKATDGKERSFSNPFQFETIPSKAYTYVLLLKNMKNVLILKNAYDKV